MNEASDDSRKKRLRFRAWHRGTRELDLILGRFADGYLDDMSESELKAFERILEAPDPDLYAWVTGRALPPMGLDHTLLRRIGGADR